ncbi:anoctamin-1 isoform X2 [Anthonomus grandis grandis]|uniref:anoctamin-1 isoform X2 n=1 Tax=Anthonomus grandis grandis TaxID=2921223 RepID=UPI0021669BFA|nr:anoctamin-1 isoform X2 [Anthonomus grandis grandis]
MSDISTKRQNDHKQQHFNDKSPLLRSSSSPQMDNIPQKSILSGKGRHKHTIHHWNTIANPMDIVNSRDKNNVYFKNNSFEPNCDTSNVSNDISAMSVVDLYRSGENLDEVMDTNRDFIEREIKHSVPHIIIKQNSGQGVGLDFNIGDNNMPQEINEKEQNNVKFTSETAQMPNSCCETIGKKCPRPTIFFSDGVRSVDFVLVWDASDENPNSPLAMEKAQKRKCFEKNLEAEGLELEYEPPEPNGLNFIKIHAPKEVLRRYSEILKLRMPMKEVPALRQVSRQTNFLIDGIADKWAKIKESVFLDKEKFPEKTYQRFTAIYSRDREYLFDTDSPCFFTPAIHSRIVQFILDRKRFSDNTKNDFDFGIERLISDEVYIAAYPLHDGDLNTEGSIRNLLYTEWVPLSKWYKYQPLDTVKEYFGVKIALYFAWLGYYTHILIAPALVGLICFIYALSTLYNHQPSNDICNSNLEEKMCPLCDDWCNYWDLKETCVHSRITYLFDNPTTVFFAIFMSLWATTFLEMWKRYSAEITHRWDLTGFDLQEEHPRPKYLAKLSHIKNVKKSVNMVTNTMEPRVPFWKTRVPYTIFSFSVVLLLVCMALATVLGVVLYRMSVLAALKVQSGKMDNSHAILFSTVTAASINLVAILIFNQIYNYVAEYLTEFELLRTQTEFDDSLTLKIYLLQFVNYYASIFYIAFFKGKFIGSPRHYNRIFGYRQEECGPGGCLLELCIQLAVIMIGKQAMNTVLEMCFPLFYKWLNTLKVKTGLSKTQSRKGDLPQWVKDYKLVEWGPRSLFPEYLEMVLQYGFVTIFVAAFPLAPLFALLNNILEMRLDAKKLLTMYRRPVSQRVRDIGVWYRILDSVGKLSVVTNGFIIAFTSDYIPRLVYRLSVSSEGTLDGYLNNSLSYFNTSDFDGESRPRNASSESICRYPDYRNPPWSPEKYDRNALYWHILAAKLIFVVIFENLVVLVMIIVKWCIPDMPGELRDKIRREAYITNEIIIKEESRRARCSEMQHTHSESTVKRKEKLRNIEEAPATPEQWDLLISKSLSQSDFDLIVHGDEQQTNSKVREESSSPNSI